METRRTNSFLRFALGVRSPEKKNYFKSKLFTTPEEIKLKVGNNKTQYNKNNNSFAKQSQQRARTSKG